MPTHAFNIWPWTLNLLAPFVIAAIAVIVISGKSRLSNPKAYLIRLVAALIIAIVMGLLVDSPWLGTIMVSTATGFLFRYW